MFAKILIDLMTGGFGLYMIYLGVKMHREQKISEVILTSETKNKCKDEKGYITYIFPGFLAFGILSLLLGILCGLMDFEILPGSSIAEMGMLALFLIGLVFFAYRMRRGKERYY